MDKTTGLWFNDQNKKIRDICSDKEMIIKKIPFIFLVSKNIRILKLIIIFDKNNKLACFSVYIDLNLK